ncbi:CvpA family protein [Persephonella sp.]
MLDIILLLFFIYLVFTGLYNGFTQIFIKGIGFLTGAYVGITFSRDLSVFLQKYFHADRVLLEFFSFFLIFVFIFSIFLLINSIVKRELKSRKKISIVDKLAGGIAGVIFFAVIIFLINTLLQKNPTLKELTSNSKIVKLFTWEK